MIMCVLLCYPVSIRIYYQQGVLFLVLIHRGQKIFKPFQLIVKNKIKLTIITFGVFLNMDLCKALKLLKYKIELYVIVALFITYMCACICFSWADLTES